MSGVQVLWGRPCLMLEPVRAFAFGQGVRAPTLGGVRPGDRLPERVVREWNPPQHVELVLHFLITNEKHKMLPVFPWTSVQDAHEFESLRLQQGMHSHYTKFQKYSSQQV